MDNTEEKKCPEWVWWAVALLVGGWLIDWEIAELIQENKIIVYGAVAYWLIKQIVGSTISSHIKKECLTEKGVEEASGN